ncbi:hypothetical protein MKW98_015406, partial [Papaver atlanticum]
TFFKTVFVFKLHQVTMTRLPLAGIGPLSEGDHSPNEGHVSEPLTEALQENDDTEVDMSQESTVGDHLVPIQFMFNPYG